MEIDDQKRKLDLIKDALSYDDVGRCLCGSRESCEICSSSSDSNRLRSKILEIINGPKRKMILEDYQRSMTIKMSDNHY